MTSFRGRPSGNRARTWDDRDRRSMLLNIGFGITIVAALLLLVIAFAATWYDTNLAPAGSVNGQTITKDEYNKQLATNAFRIDYAQRRIRTLLTAGQIRTTDAQARLSALDQRAQPAHTIALEQLIDARVMPSAAATQALADLKAGKSFEEIAKGVSTDTSSAQGGDIGFVDENAALDPAFVTALFAAAQDTPTEVIEGADGIFRVGEVTQIVEPVVDATLESQVTGEGINMNDFRASLRRDVVRSKLNDAILATYLAPGPQRKVAEIFMQTGTSESLEGAIKVRHILYSPN